MHHGCFVLRAVGEWVVAVVADLAKLSLGREDYYLREIAENREEYLSGHGESPGRWYGAGAVALGQDGMASTEAFRRTFEGRHPGTGELLGRAHGKNAVPSWDLVLRPVKDVGVLYALGGEPERRAAMSAHHEGVRAAVAYLDAQVGTRRGHGGHQKVSGRGLLVVGFDHRTSREGDPGRRAVPGRLPTGAHSLVGHRLGRGRPLGQPIHHRDAGRGRAGVFQAQPADYRAPHRT
jgi:hypothetical protein